MNPIQKETRSQNHAAPKRSYGKPALTTFGSVAKLTQGGSSTEIDGTHFTKHDSGSVIKSHGRH